MNWPVENRRPDGLSSSVSKVAKMEPDDIELGDEPIEVERRPRAGLVISVRLSPDEADEIEGIAEERKITVSQVARDAIISFLTKPSARGVAESRRRR